MSLYKGTQLISGVATPIEPTKCIGQTIFSLLPLTDAGLHLLDGTLLDGNGIYKSFVDYIGNLYRNNPTASYFAQVGELPFIQPILSSNGTVGGDSFAVEASSEIPETDTIPRKAYMSFDGKTSTKWGFNNLSSRTGWLTFYNPTPIKVKSITYTPSTDYPAEDGGNLKISASNDNSTWTDLWTGSYTANVICRMQVNSANFYKYYRITISNAIHNYSGLGELAINATYKASSAEHYWQHQVNTYGVCGKFVYDSSVNTVRLPKVTGFVAGTLDANALGSLVEAGLPSIEHTHTIVNTGSTNLDSPGMNGARFQTATDRQTGTKTTSINSSVSSIYGNSDTVTPQHIKGYMYIVVATSTKTDIQVDIDNIATDLNNKVDVSNMVEAGSYISGMGMPSAQYIDLTLGVNDTTYTAPANGWYVVSKTTTATQYLYCSNISKGYMIEHQAPYGGAPITILMPVLKGDVVSIRYNAGGTTNYFRFYYAEGELE